MRRIKITDKNGKSLFSGWLTDIPLDKGALAEYTASVYRTGDICEKRRAAARSAVTALIDSLLSEGDNDISVLGSAEKYVARRDAAHIYVYTE